MGAAEFHIGFANAGSAMARYRGSDGHYADVECAYADLERYLILKLKRISPVDLAKIASAE